MLHTWDRYGYPLPIRGGIYKPLFGFVLIVCWPLTHTPSHTAHHFNRYDRVNREKAELHLQLLEGVDSSMRAIILEQEQEHVQKTRRSEDQQRLTLEALQVGLNFRGVTYL